MSNVTVPLQKVVNLAASHADLLPLAGVGGYTDEPALSLCNDVLQELMSAPNAWKFNRAELPLFVSALYKSDYLVTGATGFVLGSSGTGAAIGLSTDSTPGISRTGTTVTVTFREPHRMTAGQLFFMAGNVDSQFNSTFTQDANQSQWSGGWTILTTPTTTSLTFTHAVSGSTTSGAPGITDFGWADSATIVDMNSTTPVQTTHTLRIVQTLPPVPSNVVSLGPEKGCVLQDNGDGTLKVRISPVPGSALWGINIVYQKKAPLKTALTQTWAPFPDEYGYVYRQGFLARCYRYINSPRSEAEDQKFQRAIAKAIGQSDEEPAEQYLYPIRTFDEY